MSIVNSAEANSVWIVACWMHEWFDFYQRIDSIWDNEAQALERKQELDKDKKGKRSKESGKGTLEEVEVLCIPLNKATMFLKKEENEEDVF